MKDKIYDKLQKLIEEVKNEITHNLTNRSYVCTEVNVWESFDGKYKIEFIIEPRNDL